MHRLEITVVPVCACVCLYVPVCLCMPLCAFGGGVWVGGGGVLRALRCVCAVVLRCVHGNRSGEASITPAIAMDTRLGTSVVGSVGLYVIFTLKPSLKFEVSAS